MIGTEGSTTITPDKELFEKYREKKEKEIEQMEQDQEVRLSWFRGCFSVA